MIPGPVDVEDDVLTVMSSPVIPHYGKEWVNLYTETVELARQVFQTRNDLFLLAGPGTAALDAALGSLLRTGEKVMIAANGFFGNRLVTVAETYGLIPVIVRFPPGEAVQPELIEAELRRQPEVQVVVVVHHETSTGVLNPLQSISQVVHQHGALLVVDAVASMGGVPLPVDDWGVDVCVTVANKCLESLPGLAPISVSPRAWAFIERKPDRAHGWYLNLQVWRDYARRCGSWHPHPTTMPTHIVLALHQSLRRIVAEGLEARFARYRRAAQSVRHGLTDLGFEMFVSDEWASPLTTAVRARPDAPADDLQAYLRDKHNLLIAGGIEELHGQIFRVGHMGKAAEPEYVTAFLDGVRDYLASRSGVR